MGPMIDFDIGKIRALLQVAGPYFDSLAWYFVKRGHRLKFFLSRVSSLLVVGGSIVSRSTLVLSIEGSADQLVLLAFHIHVLEAHILLIVPSCIFSTLILSSFSLSLSDSLSILRIGCCRRTLFESVIKRSIHLRTTLDGRHVTHVLVSVWFGEGIFAVESRQLL